MFDSFHKQDDIFENTEEVPASMPVFEGYLYWYSDKQKWKWHLFRFDGLSLICLSTRKVKLPRDTPIETDEWTDPNMPSPTSPLLATPIHPYTPYAEEVMASHYQLPSWSVNLLQVTSISLLAMNDKPQHRYCFSIRTNGKKCFLIKARKQKDLDRWLFVLTKAWHWTQVQKQIQQQHPITPPPRLPSLDISTSLKDIKFKGQPPPTPPPHQTKPSPSPQEYEANYTSPILSAEKEKWIDEWRDSLRAMAMPSPMCHPNKTSLPIVSDPSPQLNNNNTQSRSSSFVQQRQRPVSMVCQTTEQLSSGVKKKRSDEAKDWIYDREHNDYDVHYFQDTNTTDHANDTSTHDNSNYSGDRRSSPQLHYHRSTRGRSVQIITQDHNHPEQQHSQPQHVTTISPSSLHLPTSSFDDHSPLYALSKVESTHDVYKLQSTRQQTRPLSTPNDIGGIPSYQSPTDHDYRRTSNIVAPSLPPVVLPNYTMYGPIMTSSTCPRKKMQQPSPKSSGGEDDLNLVFYPSRSTPTQSTPRHSVAKSSHLPTYSFPTL